MGKNTTETLPQQQQQGSSSWCGYYPVPVSSPPREIPGNPFAHNRYFSTRSCKSRSEIVTAPERREKSLLLLLGCSLDPEDATNTWFVLPPATCLFGGNPNLPTPGVWEHVYGRTHGVLIGSHVYLIGGYSHRHICRLSERILSNFICRLNIIELHHGWEVCHSLPFYCHTTNVVVCGDLIYMFKDNGFSSSADGFPPLALRSADWAYIYDTRHNDGWAIHAPATEHRFLEVLFCAYFYRDGPKVLVCVANSMYMHDPLTNEWEEYSPIEAFSPGHSYLYATVVSNGILYYLQYFGDEHPGKPFLSAYDLCEGKNIFKLQVDSYPMNIGTSYLVAVSDTTLCWIETEPRGFFLTKISIHHHPTPSLVILKRRKFNAMISGVACCIAIDMSYGNPLLVTNRPGPLHKTEDFAANLIRNKDVKDIGLKALLV